MKLLEELGLGDKALKRPTELSGGEQQRVAIARALAVNPKLVLADEPTGNLDSATAMDVVELFRRVVDERGVTVIMVTHNVELTRFCDRVAKLRDGRIESIEEVKP